MAVAAIHLHLHLHFHRFHGPPFDYAGLAAAAALSSIGGIGPGEALLIAAAVLAAKHQLDLTEVLLVAWAGANVGGVIGWLIGYKAGRAIITARGPLRRGRLRAVERGERIFERATVTAVVFTPSWLAGIHRVRWTIYLPANALGATIWALGVGLGGYFAGPPVADMVGDLGTVALIIIGGGIVLGGVAEFARRHIKTG
ncbi:MAG TPA: VTT domain-containing protein [Solirubrobacteraceae bacterium]|jgi:membrane protein DedA with SNARE-associated domain|nr:VTT domain-containing protein [Solirubrobacteraceae bacterium]